MTLARRGLFAGLAGLLGGCSPATLLNATVSRQGFTREADIAYGTDPRQKLDLYRPDKPRADGRTVIFFYGGSWDSGSKNDYLFVAQALAASGYTVVIPDYRLYPAVRFPAFVDDGARAVRWTADRVGSRQGLRHGPFRRRPYRADARRQHALSRGRRRRSHEARGRDRPLPVPTISCR